MIEPANVQRARELVARGGTIVADQRQRIVRLHALGASTDDAEKMLSQMILTLSSLEDHLRVVRADAQRQHWI